MELKFEVK